MKTENQTQLCLCGKELLSHISTGWEMTCPHCSAEYVSVGDIQFDGTEVTDRIQVVPGRYTPDPGSKDGSPFPKLSLAFVTWTWIL